MKKTPDEILNFWFNELKPYEWFRKDELLDGMIRHRFSSYHLMAERGEFYEWRSTPRGRLAEIILLDQFSRNIYRGTPHAFQNDMMALILAEEMVLMGLDKELPPTERAFAYMPFMHSESRKLHEVALSLFESLGNEESLKFERLHKKIIDEFGRFPSRNKILGRSTTIKEQDFLNHHQAF